MKHSFFLLATFVGLGVAGSQLIACSDDEPSDRTLAQFCEDWADAACSDDVVSACQAASEDACRVAQRSYCQDLVPATFSDAEGGACIDAVRDAYSDADLTGVELDTVRRLGGDCGGIVTGTREVGQTCDTDNDCNRALGAECVGRGGFRGGICQVPVEVGAGQACSDPAQTCPDGFFCDGSNCIAARVAGDACQNDVECGTGAYCAPSDLCVARRGVGTACTSDAECESQLCYAANGQRTCADLVRLSVSEDICTDLR
jgi:hypothetical protein